MRHRKAEDDYDRFHLKRDSVYPFSPEYSPFELKCCAIQGVWGVFCQIDDQTFLADPIDLPNSLFEKKSSISLYYCYVQGLPSLYVKVERHPDYFEWTFQEEDKPIRSLYFKLEDYVKKTEKAIKILYRKREEFSYENFFYYRGHFHEDLWEVADILVKQSGKGLHLHRPTTKDIQTEVFHFYPIKRPNYHEDAYIGIGDRGYEIMISDWDCYFEGLRHQLENFVFDQKASIELTYEHFHNDARLEIEEKCIPYDTDKDFLLHSWETRVLVSIHTCRYGLIQGYCDGKQVIQTLYEGLLLWALEHELKYKERDYIRLRLPLYNILKSPIVEDYLDNYENIGKKSYIDYYEDIPQIRQQNIRTILRIEPDYDACLWYLSEDRPPLSVKDDCFEGLLDKHGKPMVVEGISAWQNELEPFLMAQACEEKTDFDWASYHKRGIALAKELRAKLPDDVDLWYSAPFEDSSGIVPQPFLVRN